MPHYKEGDILCNAVYSCVVLREYFNTSPFILVSLGDDRGQPFTRIETEDLIKDRYKLVTKELHQACIHRLKTVFPDFCIEPWEHYIERWDSVAKEKIANLKLLEQNAWGNEPAKPHANRDTVIGMISEMLDWGQMSCDEIKAHIQETFAIPDSVAKELDHIIDTLLDEDV